METLLGGAGAGSERQHEAPPLQEVKFLSEACDCLPCRSHLPILPLRSSEGWERDEHAVSIMEHMTWSPKLLQLCSHVGACMLE